MMMEQGYDSDAYTSAAAAAAAANTAHGAVSACIDLASLSYDIILCIGYACLSAHKLCV